MGRRGVIEHVDRYAIYDEIASGGMASVHLGRLAGTAGFARTVAIKRMHKHVAQDPDFVSMFVDEAKLVARIRHQNVVQTLDVISNEGELFIVMDYVHGESLSKLIRLNAAPARRGPMDPRFAATIGAGILRGLHAAHEAKGESGEALGIVHRDVSPQNIMIDSDGQVRVLDFGVAKAEGRLQTTAKGQLKGKLAYMSPEQASQHEIDRRSDIFSVGTMLWEMLFGERLVDGDNEAIMLGKLLAFEATTPSEVSDAFALWDPIILRSLARNPEERFNSALEMAQEMERSLAMASSTELAEWVERIAGSRLSKRAMRVAEIEGGSPTPPARTSVPPKESPSQPSQPSQSSQPSMPASDIVTPTPMGTPSVALRPSGVSSVSVSASRVPEPLPPGRVRMLTAAATLSAAIVALLMTAVLLVLVPGDNEEALPAPASQPLVDSQPEGASIRARDVAADDAPNAQPTGEPTLELPKSASAQTTDKKAPALETAKPATAASAPSTAPAASAPPKSAGSVAPPPPEAPPPPIAPKKPKPPPPPKEGIDWGL